MTAVGESTARRRPPLAAVLSFSLAVAAFAAGDAAMVAVCAAARAVVPGAIGAQWALSTVVISVGSYALFGMPQLRAWARTQHRPAEVDDLRSRWAKRLLNSGSGLLFVAASLVGGPLAVGWFYGRRHHPRAVVLTAASAVLLAAAWSLVYLGVLEFV